MTDAALQFLSALSVCFLLILLLRPLLQRYALARPNARSSHKIPTPQGGGIAVLLAVLASLAVASMLFGHLLSFPLTILLVAAVALAIIGAIDDIRPIPPLPRLSFQLVAVAATILALPADLRIVADLPFSVERALLILGAVWFVNLVNFMDGLDWMTVAEIAPVTAALGLFGLWGELPNEAATVAVALLGAILGFAPFNRPVAKLFLGDVGSLPIGLLLGWCLIALAQHHLAAALLLPLYYLADSTITLIRRLTKSERVWIAHRTHFYQRATDNGFSVTRVIGTVFYLNLVLATLAALSIMMESTTISLFLVAAGAGAVGVVLRRFSRPA